MASTLSTASAIAHPDITCPVCGSRSKTTATVDGWGTWQRCAECSLAFAHPLSLPKSPEELFDGAYRGIEETSGFGEFAHRVRQREALIVQPELWFWTPAFGAILDWLDERVGPGASVLEIGPGLGFFLHALRRRGFRPAGVDVARTAVELNRADGFEVWHGTVGSIPPDWIEPSAMVAMFMLHHLEDPLGTLTSIHRRWPTTPLAIAQYGPSNRYEYAAMPPRNLTQWNARSLEALLTRAGYSATVMDLASGGAERRSIRTVRRVVFDQLIRFPSAYRAGKRAADHLMRAVAPRGSSGFVLLAFAEPDSPVPTRR